MIPLRQATVESRCTRHAPCSRSSTAGGAKCGCWKRGSAAMLWHPPDGLREPRTWAIATGVDEVPWSGRERVGLDGFAAGTCQCDDGGDVVMLTTDRLRAVIRLAPFGIAWQQSVGGGWITFCADRPTYAYAAGQRTPRVVHSQARDAHDQYFGLGDKTGPLDKHGRRLRTLQLDALGYNGETSDPLYKHWPMFLGRRRDSGVCYGIYYDTLSECTFDFGQEFDNYHGFYRSTDIADGDLDCYVLAGPDLPAALARFVQLVGGTAPAATVDAGLREYGDGARRRTGRPGAARGISGPCQARAHSALCVSFRLRLYEPRQASIRVHLEPRQVSRAESADGRISGGRRASGGQPQALPPGRSSGVRGGGRARRDGEQRRRRAVHGAVLGRLGRTSRLHASGRRSRGGSAVCASRSSITASTPPGTTITSTGSGTRKAARTASERRCRSRGRVRCTGSS